MFKKRHMFKTLASLRQLPHYINYKLIKRGTYQHICKNT